MSFLVENQGSETNAEVPQPERRPNLGGLKPNPRARGRRDKVKFFDSADWAMKNQEGNDSSRSPPQRMQVYTEQGKESDDGSSLLANDNQ